MYYIALFICSLLTVVQPCGAVEKAAKKPTKPSKAEPYVKAAHIESALWEKLQPLFLPEDHPIRKKLDELFSSRVILSPETLKKAGFRSSEERQTTGAVISKHPDLKGFYLKMYTDDHQGTREWEHWVKRIKGAQSAQNTITRKGLEWIFKVPKKWIYPLPENPAPPEGYNRKNFVLVVEDMKTLSKEDNLFWWKSAAITEKVLSEFFYLIQEEGLHDSVHIDNVPFTKDGHIAFVDTEEHHHWPINYGVLLRYLSPQMKLYLRKLVKENGTEVKEPLDE